MNTKERATHLKVGRAVGGHRNRFCGSMFSCPVVEEDVL